MDGLFLPPPVSGAEGPAPAHHPRPGAEGPQTPAAQIVPLAIAIARDPGSGALEVALAPDELGRLHLHVATEGDMLRIALTVERPDTLDLLRRHADQLLGDLRQAGFSGATLSFAQGGTAGDGRAGSAPPPPPPSDPGAAAAIPAAAPPAPQYRIASGNAPLDLRL